jgi:pyruvate carboxylase
VSSGTRPAAGPSPSAARRCALAPDADPSTRRATLNRLLFPQPTAQLEQVRESYGDVSVLDTLDYLYGLRPGEEHTIALGRGVQLIAGLEAVGDADAKGMRTVLATLNGQLRPLQVRDRSVEVEQTSTERAEVGNDAHVAAPFSGVVTLRVAVGDEVEAGQVVASIEAMKMEAAITTARAGTVQRLAVGNVQQVEGGDLVVVLA